jgi:hypothetical protein
MAIYTNYGRYLKAKKFKESLEAQSETYMLFGLGNPQWDVDTAPDNDQFIPVAPYNTSIMLGYLPDDTSVGDNQFDDNHASQWFNFIRDETIIDYKETLRQSSPIWPGSQNSYINKCKNIVPPFPCIWQNFSSDRNIISGSDVIVTQNDYHEWCITNDASGYWLHNAGDSLSDTSHSINKPDDSTLDIQYFSEMYIRGKALEMGIKAPVGLLGAVKCDINFVKDIGPEDNNRYTGDINQFWYGDRYWEIVRVNDSDLDNYIGKSDDQLIYPHHLIFTATVNPRSLCDELLTDQYLVPRHIALFTRKKEIDSEHSTIDPINPNNSVIVYKNGKNYYRAYENIFNFGQYTTSELESLSMPPEFTGEILNFTIPCSVDSDTYPDGEFKFLLNDYIRGQIRQVHSIDRFGYVIGF